MAGEPIQKRYNHRLTSLDINVPEEPLLHMSEEQKNTLKSICVFHQPHRRSSYRLRRRDPSRHAKNNKAVIGIVKQPKSFPLSDPSSGMWCTSFETGGGDAV